MKHTKQIIAILTLLSVSSSVFAATATSTSTTTASGASAATTTSTSATSTSSAPIDKLSVLGDPVLVSQTATSVTIRWEKVEAAKWYIVKYGKKSVSKAFEMGDVTVAYESETDQVTSTGTTISNLNPDTTYYFAIVGLDAAKNESSATSKELSVTLVSGVNSVSTGTGVATTATGETSVSTKTTTATGATLASSSSTGSSLKLSSVTVIDEKTLTVDFSASLSKSPVTLKVRKSSDNSTVNVASVTNDMAIPSRVKVTLAAALSPSSSYSIIVIDATDVKGLPISEGVNAQKEFATTATLAKAGIKLNAAPEEGTGATTVNTTASWAATPPVVPAVTTTTALPPTGTQETLIIVIAAIVSMGIMYGVRRKRV